MSARFRPYIFFITGVIISGVFFFCISFKGSDNNESSVDVSQDGRLQYKWYAPTLPKSMSFAGEKVPLDRQDIREQLDRELLYNYYNIYSTLYILKLSHRYFPLIEERLKANGVPDDFKYLCVAESALQNQISRAGAVGFWQFMKDTGPKYGLQIDEDVDERYNIKKATDAACLYFQAARQRFGSWTAAAASYNCGLNGFDNQATYQETENYYNLLLPEETMRYVFRILALKYLITSAEKMGFILQDKDEYKPYNTKTVTISSTIPDLEQYASDNGITYRTLKMFNPWMRSHTLPVRDGKTYEVILPTDMH